MVRRYRRSNWRLAVLWLMPLLLVSVSYAAYSQTLTLSPAADKPAYSSSDNLDITYEKSVIAKAGKWQHTVSPLTIINHGPADVSAWQVTFTVPAGSSNLSCGSANCSLSGQTVTVTNNASNGTILAGASTAVSVVFRTSLSYYVLQNITVSGTVEPIFQTMAGLTATMTAGTQTKKGKWYTTPYSVTVTNNSGQALSLWRLRIPWDSSTSSVTSIPANLNYYTVGSELIILSTTGLANGQSTSFSVTFRTSNQTWTAAGYEIEGNI